MLFKPYHVPLIKRRQKTETRRIWPHGPRVREGSIHQGKTKMMTTRHFGHLRILKLWRQKLGDMTEEDAHAEGCQTLAEYREVWERINGSWDPSLEVYAVRFCLLDELEGGHHCLECGKRVKVIRVEPYDGFHEPTGIWLYAMSLDTGDKTLGCLCNNCAADLCEKGIVFEGCNVYQGRLYVEAVLNKKDWEPKHPEFLLPDEDDEEEHDPVDDY